MTPSDVPAARKRLVDLTLLSNLAAFTRFAPGAEPPHDELLKALKAGRQPYPIVVCDNQVLFGVSLIAAAKTARMDYVEVVECPDCEGLDKGDRLIKAAGLHIRNFQERMRPAPFELQLFRAAVYEAWRENCKRRGPRQSTSATIKKDRTVLRQKLISEAFGLAQRSVGRFVALRAFQPDLQAAFRDGRLPIRDAEKVRKLSRADQDRLATRLATGARYADVSAEFFELVVPRQKSYLLAKNSIRAKLHGIAADATNRTNFFPLTINDFPAARTVVELLTDWLAAETPEDSETERLGDIVEELRHLRNARAIATRGGRGASGGAR